MNDFIHILSKASYAKTKAIENKFNRDKEFNNYVLYVSAEINNAIADGKLKVNVEKKEKIFSHITCILQEFGYCVCEELDDTLTILW